MKIQFKFWHKILITMVAFAAAIVGFMIKLPSVFSHSDKMMHSLFYFGAAGFLNILFAKRNLLIHAFIFGLLYAFGVIIEYAQQYSNTFFHNRIHGNADPEDMYANLQGLMAFSAIWVSFTVLMFLWNAFFKKEKGGNEPGL